MIQAGFFALFDFIGDTATGKKGKVAQIILLLGVGYIILKTRDGLRDRETAKRIQRRAAKQTRKIIDHITEETSNDAEQAISAGRAVLEQSDPPRMSEHRRSRLSADR